MRAIVDRLGWGVAGAATVALIAVLAGIVSAGPLDPSDPPGETTGVRLPGTPISDIPYTISTPGHYYLTNNVTGDPGENGITITISGVTLDLNGFALLGVPDAVDGIVVETQGPFKNGISIRNGWVRGWPGSGVQAQWVFAGVFDSLRSVSNGQWGFVINAGSTLTHCAAYFNGFSGINAENSLISDCTSYDNGQHGFQINRTVLTDCIASSNNFDGVKSGSSSHISNCQLFQNGSLGITATSSTVTDNEVHANGGTGILIEGAGSLVARNNVHDNASGITGAGIDVTGTDSRIDENHVSDVATTPFQDFGIRVTGAENVVVRNSSHGNGTNYNLVGVNGDYGPEQPASTSTSPWANLSY